MNLRNTATAVPEMAPVFSWGAWYGSSAKTLLKKRSFFSSLRTFFTRRAGTAVHIPLVNLQAVASRILGRNDCWHIFSEGVQDTNRTGPKRIRKTPDAHASQSKLWTESRILHFLHLYARSFQGGTCGNVYNSSAECPGYAYMCWSSYCVWRFHVVDFHGSDLETCFIFHHFSIILVDFDAFRTPHESIAHVGKLL